MANYWMHNGFLQVEGEKMSKSAGNFVTIRDLLKHTDNFLTIRDLLSVGPHGWWPGDAIRLNMLRSNYRQPIDWTVDGLKESYKTLQTWYEDLDDKEEGSVPNSVLSAVADDLNTSQAIAELHELRKTNDHRALLSALRFLGFSAKKEALVRTVPLTGSVSARVFGRATLTVTPNTPSAAIACIETGEIERLMEARKVAREAKNFKESDRIRDELSAMGVVLKDSKDGTTWEIAR
jgi:cysteinyl-tRNA synthetase